MKIASAVSGWIGYFYFTFWAWHALPVITDHNGFIIDNPPWWSIPTYVLLVVSFIVVSVSTFVYVVEKVSP